MHTNGIHLAKSNPPKQHHRPKKSKQHNRNKPQSDRSNYTNPTHLPYPIYLLNLSTKLKLSPIPSPKSKHREEERNKGINTPVRSVIQLKLP